MDTDDRFTIFGGAINGFVKPRHPAKGDQWVLHFHRDEMTAMDRQNAVALDTVTEGIRCHNSPFPVRPSRGTRCQPRDAIRKLDEDLKLFLRRDIEQTCIYIQRLFRIGFREKQKRIALLCRIDRRTLGCVQLVCNAILLDDLDEVICRQADDMDERD